MKYDRGRGVSFILKWCLAKNVNFYNPMIKTPKDWRWERVEGIGPQYRLLHNDNLYLVTWRDVLWFSGNQEKSVFIAS